MCCTPVVFDNFPFWNTSALWWSRGSTGLSGTGGTEGIEGIGLGGTEGTGGTGLGGHLDHRTRAKTKGGAVAMPRFRRKSLVLPIIMFIYLFFVVLIVFFSIAFWHWRKRVGITLTLPSVLPWPLQVGSGLETAVFLLRSQKSLKQATGYWRAARW